MAGDSLRDDIAQAQEAGLRTVLIDQNITRDNPFLATYNADVDAVPDYVLSSVTDLPGPIPPRRARAVAR